MKNLFSHLFDTGLPGLKAAGLSGLLCCLLAGPVSGQSITVEELAQRLVDGQVRFLLDVRRSHSFESGHIPNAINIPVNLLESRRLPAIGEVFVYDEGLGSGSSERAVSLLLQKEGIIPLVLEGGYAAWKTRSGVTTSPSGFSKQTDAHITYQDLKSRKGEGAVIYDLRSGKGNSAVELKDHFPEAQVARGSPYALLNSKSGGARLASATPSNPFLKKRNLESNELIVLIDDDNSSATETAQRLRAGGFNRVAILAGGEMIIDFEGRAGLERRGRGSLTIDPAEATGEEQGASESEGNP